MNFKLKIVEGPNKGAEIALPEGVAVTLGKSDDSDIVLADATLPDAALTLKAAPDGVTLDGEPLEPFAVTERGTTAFAVGPADKPWGELVWPKKEENLTQSRREAEGSEGADASAPSEPSASPRENPPVPPQEKKKRRGCLGCLLWTVLLLVVLGALGWFFRHEAQPYVEKARPYLDQAKPYAGRVKNCAERVISGVAGLFGESGASVDSGLDGEPSRHGDPVSLMQDIIRRYGLMQTNRAGRTVLSGDFATRAERLTATAEAYAASPGIELDFSDVESLTAAAEDTFALVGESDLHVAAATNRVIVLSGKAANLRRTLEALAADLPKLRDVNVSGVSFAANGDVRGRETPDGRRMDGTSASRVSRLATRKPSSAPTLPVCGILTTPYPCLVLKSGARVMQGAPLGEWTVARIDADSVTLTNAERSVTWNP